MRAVDNGKKTLDVLVHRLESSDNNKRERSWCIPIVGTASVMLCPAASQGIDARCPPLTPPLP